MDHLLPIIMRLIHIVSAVAAVGGLLFAMFCVKPSMRVLDDGLCDSVLEVMRKRFMRIQIIAIIGLVISGVYSWMQTEMTYKAMGGAGNALIGVKVLLAMIMFAVVFMRATDMIKSEKAAQMIVIHLAAVVIVLAVILRTLRLAHLAS